MRLTHKRMVYSLFIPNNGEGSVCFLTVGRDNLRADGAATPPKTLPHAILTGAAGCGLRDCDLCRLAESPLDDRLLWRLGI